MKQIEEMKKRWNRENLPGHFNHTDDDQGKLFNNYKIFIKKLSHYDFNGKTIIDYGCGGGWLGKFLFENYAIKEYIGMDISEKSLSFAKENLKDYSGKKFINIKDVPDFSKYNADVFVSLFTFQHFPDLEYTRAFMKALNECGCKNIICQYRVAKDNKLHFIDRSHQGIWMATFPKDSVNNHLSNYGCIISKDHELSGKTDNLRTSFFEKKSSLFKNRIGNNYTGLFDFCEYINNVYTTKELTILEIGSFAGESACIFSRYFKKVICVDSWSVNNAQGNMKECIIEAEKVFDEVIKDKNIEKIKMNSIDAVKKFDDKSIDILYIDGHHSYDSVLKDIKAWFPKCKLFISGHDYRNGKNEDVIKAVNEIFVKPDKTFSDWSWIVRIE